MTIKIWIKLLKVISTGVCHDWCVAMHAKHVNSLFGTLTLTELITLHYKTDNNLVPILKQKNFDFVQSCHRCMYVWHLLLLCTHYVHTRYQWPEFSTNKKTKKLSSASLEYLNYYHSNTAIAKFLYFLMLFITLLFQESYSKIKCYQKLWYIFWNNYKLFRRLQQLFWFFTSSWPGFAITEPRKKNLFKEQM